MTEKQKEYYKQYRKKYYQDHKEYFKNYCKQWRKDNRERCNELRCKYRDNKASELIAQGIINPYAVINYKAKPKYIQK